MSNLIVRPHRPWRNRLLGSGLVLLIGASGWGLFEFGRYRAGFDVLAAGALHQQLENQIGDLQRQIAEHREQRAVLERSRQIETTAHQELEATVAALQDEILELKGELAFYRGIVAPRETAQGLRLQNFEVVRNAAPRSYRYKLVLTQVLKNDNVATGSVGINIEGSLGGKLTVLSLDKVSADAAKDLRYKFKYFQNLDGDIVLPEGFIPSRVTVKVEPRGKQHAEIEKVFDWPAEET